MNKKDLLAKVISRSGLLALARTLLKPSTDSIIVLAYHRIYNIDDEDSFPFDPELISATPSDFKQQMQYIKKHYNAVSLNDVIEHQKDNNKLPPNPIVITFDDGHEDNFTQAYPILSALNIPATIFLSTEYIGSNKIFWFDWVAHAIYETNENTLSLNNENFSINLGTEIIEKREATMRTLSYLMTLSNSNRITCLKEIKHQLAVKVSEKNMKKSSALNWDQIIEMSKNGIEFGSHTVSHPILSKLDDAQLSYELSHSKSEIESRTKQTVNTIAYPVGGRSEFTDDVIKACKESGYQLGLSYISGTEKIKIEKLFEIKRLHIERYTTLNRFKAMLTIPSIFK